MLEKVDSNLISEYMAYDSIVGIGNERLIIMLAQLTSLLANVNGGKTKIKDFLVNQERKEVSLIDKIKAVFSG